jgi:hypothetical protein
MDEKWLVHVPQAQLDEMFRLVKIEIILRLQLASAK